MKPTPDEALTIEHVAAPLKLAEKSLYVMTNAAAIPALKFPGRRCIKRTELALWMDAWTPGSGAVEAAAAARSVDELLTLRSWLIGVWFIAFEQDGADRAAYGEGIIDALAVQPELIRQTPSADLVPVLPARSEPLAWQDDAWHARLRQALSFSHLLELSRVQEPLARACYEVQALGQRWSVRLARREMPT
ncbi:MAG: hypothetical protein IPI49_25865 [Myxococcales bacterium]|nr:hypothetical protein [Myxococcales bacterium]HRC55388.1 hypothetical protein [Kofleriaceae bacterium]